jgi:predicted deacylase
MGHTPIFTIIFLALCAASSEAGEVSVDPGDNGADVVVDTTEDTDSRSSEVAVAVENLVDPAPTLAELPAIPLADAVTAAGGAATTVTILGTDVEPGTAHRLSWSATELFEGVPVSTPVLVVNGALPGPTLCLTAAVHGDELNGIEMVRRVMHDLDPTDLSGAIIGIPIVNVQGFRRGSRYLPDRRDLNRYFPGNPTGSAAARIADSFFTNVVSQCDALVDLHTGSFERANLPQIRADLRNPDVMTLTQGTKSNSVSKALKRSSTRWAWSRSDACGANPSPSITVHPGCAPTTAASCSRMSALAARYAKATCSVRLPTR